MLDFHSFSGALLDMDGVLYVGNSPLPGVPELLNFFNEANIAYACITNSSKHTPTQLSRKLSHMGVEIASSKIITSAQVVRRYLEATAPAACPILAIGMDGLNEILFSDGRFRSEDNHPAYVVVGNDENFNYAKACQATRAILRGAEFLGTNPDVAIPSDQGLLPETGAILAYLTAATGVKPRIFGKPYGDIFETGITQLGIEPAQVLIIGDRLDTDIAGANAFGMKSALLLTGVTSPQSLQDTAYTPDAVYADLYELRTRWERSCLS
jgi:4-nitrophenyl phosphatase